MDLLITPLRQAALSVQKTCELFRGLGPENERRGKQGIIDTLHDLLRRGGGFMQEGATEHPKQRAQGTRVIRPRST